MAGFIKSKLPRIDLFDVRDREFIIAYPLFGKDRYESNIEEMSKEYTHSVSFPEVSFRESQVKESLEVITTLHNDGWSCFLDDFFSEVQLGRIIKTNEGIFSNLPKDDKENIVYDIDELKERKEDLKESNGIFMGEDGFSFGPYESLEKEYEIKTRDFLDSNIVRLLMGTEKRPKGLENGYLLKYDKNVENYRGIKTKNFTWKPEDLGSKGFKHGILIYDIVEDWNGHNIQLSFRELKPLTNINNNHHGYALGVLREEYIDKD